MKNFKIKAAMALLVCLAAWTVWQDQQNKRLLAERVVLREQLSQGAILTDELQRSVVELKSNLERLRADQVELMRLRDQASRMRRLEQENVQLKAGGTQSIHNRTRAEQARHSSDGTGGDDLASDGDAFVVPPGVANLGEVEFVDQIPTTLELGGGNQCTATATKLADGQVQMVFRFESQLDGGPIRTEQTTTLAFGKRIIMTAGGLEFAFIPRLKTQ